jgi:hypothetical protein
MRWFLVLPVMSMLALPIAACAQDQSPPQPPMADQAGAAAGQYQPGTLPPEPPVIEPPLPGQPPLAGQADNMAPPPPGPDDGQPPLPGSTDDGQPPPPPPGGYGAPAMPGAYDRGQGGHEAEMMQKFQRRFEAANTTHDGRLTLDQAQAGNLRSIVKHFNEIDTRHVGYVTLNEVMAWKMDQMAQQMERRAAALRAQQGQ